MNRLESLHEQLDNIKRFGISENPGDFQGTFLSRDIPALLAVAEAMVALLDDSPFCPLCAVYVHDNHPHLDGCPLIPLLEEEA